MLDLLKKYWGYDSFRPLQREATAAVLEGRDSLVVLPTGGGKSLCFQAPAIAMDGMAVVVSPLISLMKDQVDALTEAGVPAACINSAMSSRERREVDASIRAGELKLLYVSPERLVTTPFLDYLSRVDVSFVAVDEAHCVSHWGHDFRPEYRELGCVKKHFPDIAVHAYTATATQRVRDDICAELNLREPEVFVGSFDRPNLVYRAERRSSLVEQIRAVADRHKNESGLVYCITRKSVDQVVEVLRAAGYGVAGYHAGMDNATRKDVQESFLREDVNIIVATVAFGMGIDKSNVRYVVHAGMPKSVEHYQQETGRAGRDGLEAECVLIHSPQDLMTWRRIFEGIEDEQRGVAMRKLDEMAGYASTVNCRHKVLVEYFGEAYTKRSCNACDMCLGSGNLVEDSESIAQAVFEAVDQIGDFAGPGYTTLVLAGSKDERVTRKGHDRLRAYGGLAEFEERTIRDWIEQLVSQGFLEKRGEYNILSLTADARVQGIAARLLKPAEKRKAQRASVDSQSWEGVDRALFEKLRELRKELARERSTAPFIVFSDAALRDIARRRPATRGELLQAHGVGEKKCDEYGDAVLQCIRDHGGDGPAVGAVESEAPRARKRPLTAEAAFVLFEEGQSIEEVAERLQRARSTTVGYLVDYIRSKDVRDPSPWIPPEIFERVHAAAQEVGELRATPIREFLNEELSFEQIQIALCCLRNEYEERA